MAADLLTASGLFIYNNLLGIILVTIVFFAITIFYALNNIHLEEPKLKTAKVVVLEKMDNLQTAANNQMHDNKYCADSVKDYTDPNIKKSTCSALGTCVWVTGKDGSEKISKCVAAQKGNTSGVAAGSLGPEDKCFKRKNGQLAPWEEFYYQNGPASGKKLNNSC